MTNSPIPAELERLLSVVGENLVGGKSATPDLSALVSALSNLPANAVSRAAIQISLSTRRYVRTDEPSWFQKMLRRTPIGQSQVMRTPGMEYLFLFHFDGRLREIALQTIQGGLASPFWFAAVCLRLNDWAEPVRRAAFLCAERCFPATKADVVAEGVLSLALAQSTWGRWHFERAVLDAAINRTDVIAQIAKIISERPTGPVSKIFQLALRNSAIDIHLPQLAAQARQPAVRAMAVQTIADMKATWPIGWEWRWIDKSMGRRVRVPKLDRRNIEIEVNRIELICAAASDKAAIVRRAALDALIQHYPSSACAAQIARQLKDDKNHSVRGRAAFIISKTG